MNESVAAIIVTYRPNLDALDKLFASIIEQVDLVLIIDNGSDLGDFSPRYRNSKVQLVTLGHNKGVAAAQNVGITLARKLNADYVLLFDQDSVAAPDMVARLLEAIKSLQNAACVGPRYLDIRQDNPPPFIRIEGLKLCRCRCDTDEAIVRVDYLISSGCLIPMRVIDAIGGPRDELFIDYVDIEWGLRAKVYGMQSYGICGAKMSHSLGDEPLTFLGRNIPIHSPLRHYYHFRNAIWLYKQSWLPLNWKIVDGWRLLLKFVFYSLFAKPRYQHLKMMLLGSLHGLVGHMGPLYEER